MRTMKFGVGQPVKRVEDVRFVSGQGALHVRPRARGRAARRFPAQPARSCANFASTDLEAARALPGVKAVFVARDFAALGDLPCLAQVPEFGRVDDAAEALSGDGGRRGASRRRHRRDGGRRHAMRRRATPSRRSTSSGRRAPAVVDMEAAIEAGAPQVFAGAPGNIAYDAHIGDKAGDRRRLRHGRACGRRQGRQSARRRQLSWSRAARSPNMTRRPAA